MTLEQNPQMTLNEHVARNKFLLFSTTEFFFLITALSSLSSLMQMKITGWKLVINSYAWLDLF